MLKIGNLAMKIDAISRYGKVAGLGVLSLDLSDGKLKARKGGEEIYMLPVSKRSGMEAKVNL